MLQEAAAFLGEQMKLAAGRPLFYTGFCADGRENSQRVELTGWVTEHVYEVDSGDGWLQQVKSFDFSFVGAELLRFGEPKCGDLIEEALAGVTGPVEQPRFAEYRYEAMKLGKRPCFEWHDSAGVLIVVHTKRIASDPDRRFTDLPQVSP